MESEQIKNFCDRLLDLPKSIQAKQNQILSISEELLKYKKDIEQIEGDLKIEISNETDPNGKKSFTNAETRDLEFKSRILNNVELIQLNEKYSTINRTIQEIKNDIEMEQNTQRNIRAVLGIVSTAVY